MAGPVLVFMLCVALATYAQNLTGFAFSLILLGLVSVFHVASVHDAANAAMVLTLSQSGLVARLVAATGLYAAIAMAFMAATGAVPQ